MISDIIELLKTAADRFIPDTNKRKEAKEALDHLTVSGDLEFRTKGQEIAAHEAKSDDKWTSRARPSFLYILYFYLLLAPVFGLFFMIDPVRAGNAVKGMELFLAAIPDQMWQVLWICFGVYGVARSTDKAFRVNAWTKAQKYAKSIGISAEQLKKIKETIVAIK